MQRHSMLSDLLLIATGIVAGMAAGLFYAYSCSVNIGLGQLNDREYLTAMQSVNKAILNPLFFMSFLGTLFLVPLSGFLEYRAGISGCFILLATAGLIYIVGVFGITLFGNVPLNDALARINPGNLSATELIQVRLKFEKPWLALHQIRTAAAVVSFTLVLFALLFKYRA